MSDQHDVRRAEYRLQQRQEQSQRTDAILTELREIPPYEPVALPEWLPLKGGD